jgi:hypothetical protein
MLAHDRGEPSRPLMRLPRMTRTRLWIIVAAVAVLLSGAILQDLRTRRARVAADRHEVKVKALLKDEPLANMSLSPPRDGFTGLLFRVGIRRPAERAGERAYMRINPVDPIKGLTRPAGPTIDACRKVSGGVPAELILLRKVLVPDPVALLGPYSSRSKENFRRIKDIEFYTYGNLDVGIKDGALIVVRVR